jgi:hypothetical protein
VAADNAAFAGEAGARLRAIEASLAGGRSDLAALLRVAPSVEVRSRAPSDASAPGPSPGSSPGSSPGGAPGTAAGGALVMGADWNLAVAPAAGFRAPVTLTLRAAGDLLITHSVQDGFGTGAPGAGAAPQGAGGSLRFVGGADFAAADPLATIAGAGDLRVGRPAASPAVAPPTVLVRSTTGGIELAAGGDVELGATRTGVDGSLDRRSAVRVATTGLPVPAAGFAGLERLGIRATDQFQRVGTVTVGPFFEGAGAVSITAARDVIGRPAVPPGAGSGAAEVQYVTDWWFRQANEAGAGPAAAGFALWSRLDLFAQGVASFGGGAVSVAAGRDVRDLDASTPLQGFAVAGSAAVPAAGRLWAGGTLAVEAGRDVSGGLLYAGGATGRLVAGRDVASRADDVAAGGYAATQLLHGATAWSAGAGRDLVLAGPSDPAQLAGAVQGNDREARSTTVVGLADTATARLVAAAGDLRLGGARPPSTTGTSPGAGGDVLPDTLFAAAPRGPLAARTVAQRPAGERGLVLLAGESLSLEGLRVTAGRAESAPLPTAESPATTESLFNVNSRRWSRTEDGSAPAASAPVELAAGAGELRLEAGASFAAAPLSAAAGGDLVIDANLRVQHAPTGADEGAPLTRLEAGRDLRFGAIGGLRLAGPGDLVALAGRDIDTGRGNGIVSIGNQDNDAQLPRGGANLVLVAGATAADAVRAAAAGFQLDGAGLAEHPGRVAVQLERRAAGQPLLEGEALARAAAAFDARSFAERRARAAALLGEAALAAAETADVERALAQAIAVSEAATAAVREGRVIGSTRLSGTPPVPGSEFLPGETVLPAGASEAVRAARVAEVRQRLTEALADRALGAALAQAASALPAPDRDALRTASAPHGEALRAFVAERTGGPAPATVAAADAAFRALPPSTQWLFLARVLGAELRAAGRATLAPPDVADAGAPPASRVGYLRAYDAVAKLFAEAPAPAAPVAVRAAAGAIGTPATEGRITLAESQVRTAQGGDVRLVAARGGVNVGDLVGGGIAKSAAEIGVVTVAGGAIEAIVRDSVEVNQSRIFTLAEGDLMLWSLYGNLDAGRGAKTVVGAAPPIVTIDANGQVLIDTSGSFSGSGIAVLSAASTADLFAPMGEINAGDAGISAAGRLNVGAQQLVNFDNVQASVPIPSQRPEPPSTAALAGVGQAAAASTTSASASPRDEEEERRARRPRRNLFLDFLGFARGD